MYSIPLSATPINTSALADVLNDYKGRPMMDIVDDFEERIKIFTGSPYVLALNSGTAAIHLSLKVLGVGPGDFVIAPTFTYVATINPILYLGAQPIFIDSEPITWNMDPYLLDKAIQDQIKRGNKPKAVIIVHGYGMPARMNELNGICKKYEIPVVEDAAEAIGSTYFKSQAGTLGDVGILSFNNNKVMTTYGGGALLTKSEEVYRKCAYWATQSRENKPYYEHSDVGFNYRMGPLNAASGLVGMKEIVNSVQSRRKIHDSYIQIMEDIGLDFTCLIEPDGIQSSRWLSAFLFKSLNISNIVSKMSHHGIECRRLWNPMHLQPVFRNYLVYGMEFAEKLFDIGLCLPSSNPSQVNDVIERLKLVSR